ncbi:MAG: hypothetical protein HY897_15005 [Deltaproteobacteria bacterium]|nr:hypothetical protein [Deltaproteobacteria bacterium]
MDQVAAKAMQVYTFAEYGTTDEDLRKLLCQAPYGARPNPGAGFSA